MNKFEANKAVNAIEAIIHDDELAIIAADGLYIDFIKAVAAGKYSTIEEANEVASIVLEVEDMDFARWCA